MSPAAVRRSHLGGMFLAGIIVVLLAFPPTAGAVRPFKTSAADPLAERSHGRPPLELRPSADVEPKTLHPMVPRPTGGNSGGIDPYEYETSEPAAMGVTDYGVTSAHGAWYRYSTPRVVGNASIGALRALNTTLGLTLSSFQLNAEIVLTNGSTTKVLWFQEIAQLNTTNTLINWEDNVWNLSANSTTAGLPGGSAYGNGTTHTDRGYSLYIDVAGNSYPGNAVSLTYPAQVTEEMVATEIAGVPHVGMRYEDGYGWQTFDNISIPWAHNWTLEGFVVDGSQGTPIGGFYDLEFDLAGPGDDLSDQARAANVTMNLQFWNGHNFQDPPNAYNFGSNTGESIGNISESSGFNASGEPSASLGTGPGGLGLLYGHASAAELNVTANISTGVLRVDSDPIPFVGGGINLTLGPGRYNLTLLEGPIQVASISIHLLAGEYLPLLLGGIRAVPVWFNETGLAPGTEWSVTMDQIAHTSETSTIEFEYDPGAYAYSVGELLGFTALPASGELNVTGPTSEAVAWMVTLYSVTLTSVGLPFGTPWNITLNGVTNSTSGGVLGFEAASGGYPIGVGVGPDYTSNDSGAELTILGENESSDIYFQPVNGLLQGTVSPGSASVLVNGSAVTVSDGTFQIGLFPGSYTVDASASGFLRYATDVVVRPGAITPLHIQLNPTPSPGSGTSSPAGGSPPVDLLAGAIAVAIGLVVGLAFYLTRRR